MRDIVSLAERREAACKDEISTLLASRSTMYEAAPAWRACLPPAPAQAAPAAVAGPEQAAAQEEDEGREETLEAAAAKMDEAEKRMEVAKVGCGMCLSCTGMRVYTALGACVTPGLTCLWYNTHAT